MATATRRYQTGGNSGLAYSQQPSNTAVPRTAGTAINTRSGGAGSRTTGGAFGDAQTQAWLNQQTAIDQKLIGDENVVTPTGSVHYTGTPGVDYTRHEQLNPTRQQALDWSDWSRALGANQGFYRLRDFNRQYGPMSPDEYGPMGNILRESQLPDAMGFDPESIREVEDATFSRGRDLLAPLLREERAGLDSQLANQGIAGETVAAMRARDRQGRRHGEMMRHLAIDAIDAGRREHSRLAGLGMSRRGQEAALQGQAFQQAEGRRRSNLDMERLIRSQLMNEMLTNFNLGDVQPTPFAPSAQPGMAPVDFLGAQANQANLDQQRSTQNRSFLSSLLGTALPIAASFIPGVGPAAGAFMGAATNVIPQFNPAQQYYATR